MGAQGTTEVDFGAFPGKSDASVTVTGQAGILAGSLVEAWIRPVDTVDHSADEHMVESLKIFAHTIVAGTGFTISMFNTSETQEPLTRNTQAQAQAGLGINYARILLFPKKPEKWEHGGTGTRIYGKWTVAWVWN